MSGHGLVVLDGDDTLWVVESLYDEARAQARLVVDGAGYDGADWERRERAIDVANVERLGFSLERFPRSCVEAFEQVALPSDPNRPAVSNQIRSIAAQVFLEPAPLVPGVEEILCELGAHWKLALLTQGDVDVQKRRVVESGLESLFDKISIVPRKDLHEFNGVLSAVAEPVFRAWSVGNSYASDILPALQLGMSAVWVDAHVWEYERRPASGPNEADRLFKAERLSQVPEIIRQHAWTQAC